MRARTVEEIRQTLPPRVIDRLEYYRNEYRINESQARARSRSAGYVSGLYDAGLITDRERRQLFLYITTV